MNSWEELKNAVGQWSVANFGSQNGLGCITPLLGMCEELGELDAASTVEDAQDAKGDILIFLMDYCYRAGVDLSLLSVDLSPCSYTTVEAVGRLHHVQLKRLQRIRGMDDYYDFRSAQFEAVCSIIRGFVIRYRGTREDQQPFHIAKEVFTTVVQKRKWHDVIDKPLSVESCSGDYQRVVNELNNLE